MQAYHLSTCILVRLGRECKHSYLMLALPERLSIMVIMNRMSTERRAAVVRALVEGCSVRATVRMTGASKNTVVKLLAELGAACTKYQDVTLRNLACRRLQCDEIWSFVGGKDKNI